MSEHRQLVTDDGALHKYRTEIPNTIIRGIMGSGLTLPARWLYVYLKSIAGDCGECWQNMTTLASGSRLSRGAVSNARKELIEAKLIAMTKGKGALHETDRIRILDIWDQNMVEFRREASSPHEHGPSSLHEHAGRAEELYSTQINDSRVHHMNTTSSLSERASSPHEQPSSPDEPKKISLKKIPDLEEEIPSVLAKAKTSPPGEKRVMKEKRVKRYMPKEETAQRAMLASILDSAFDAWLVEKYPDADSHAQWEYFVNYCLSSGRQYADFRAAFMNSFSWGGSPAQQQVSSNGRQPAPRSLSFAEQKRNREADAVQRFLGGSDAGSDRPTSLRDRDDPAIDGIEYHRVDD
jgi:Helix-turn-helix domain